MEKRRIEIPYAPRAWVRKLHASFRRWVVLVLHRRVGKTMAVLNHHQRAAMDKRTTMRQVAEVVLENLDTAPNPPA